MSLPIVPETATVEEIADALKNGSTIYVENDSGETIGTHTWSEQEQAFCYMYLGRCKKHAPHHIATTLGIPHVVPGECVEWVYPPFTKMFKTIEDMALYVAFVGSEWS